MKKYLSILFIVVTTIIMGNVVATTIEANNLEISKSITSTVNVPQFRTISNLIYQILERFPNTIRILQQMGTLGGGCGGGCHNNSNMTEITGILLYDGTKFSIDPTILHFGGHCYINSTTSPYDFDGDGTIETILNELLGLVGTSITVKGYLCCQNTKLIVFYINGILYRECTLRN